MRCVCETAETINDSNETKSSFRGNECRKRVEVVSWAVEPAEKKRCLKSRPRCSYILISTLASGQDRREPFSDLHCKARNGR